MRYLRHRASRFCRRLRSISPALHYSRLALLFHYQRNSFKRACPVLSTTIPLQHNVARIPCLVDEALAPIVAPVNDSDGDDDVLDPHGCSNTTPFELIDSFYKEISNSCLLLLEQAPVIEAIQYINRVCSWVHEATSDLRHVCLRVLSFHSDSMSITTHHWVQKLGLTLGSAPYKGINNNKMSKHILHAIFRFLGPSIKQDLLLRSPQKGHVTVGAVLTHLVTLQEEVDRPPG